jgi:hypothetical protein
MIKSNSIYNINIWVPTNGIFKKYTWSSFYKLGSLWNAVRSLDRVHIFKLDKTFDNKVHKKNISDEFLRTSNTVVCSGNNLRGIFTINHCNLLFDSRQL